MEEIEEQKPEKEKKNTSLILFMILFILSLGLNIFLYFNYVSKAIRLETENEELIALLDASNLKADSLQDELDRTYASLQQKLDEAYALESESRENYEQTVIELEKAKARISSLIAQANSGGGSVALAKARAEIDKLKQQNKNYETELDDLKKVYAIAQDAADNFSGKVNYYQAENDSLLEVNDTLNSRMGRLAILRIADLFITPQREKKDEFIPTFKASKVENLKISFTILPSKAIAPGEKDLIVRIVGPGGVVLLENLNTLRNSDELYSMEHTVDYTGKEQKVKLTYNQEAEYKSGPYTLELYQNNQLLDRISFVLD